MMDIWGVVWLLFFLFVFPFGYKPTVLILSLAAIFNASVILKVGGSALPLYTGIELLVILRLLLPYRGSGFLKFNDFYTFFIFITIIFLWVYTYLVANFFAGIKVYSGQSGFETNFSSGGIPLEWGGANINQLVLLSVHLILVLLMYKRRNYISQDFYLFSIFCSTIVFSIFSFMWKFLPALYMNISELFFNNSNKNLPPAVYEARLSGTFSEPSYAGVFIGTFSIIFLLNKKLSYKVMGLILLYLGFLNLSSSFVFTLLVSVFVLFFLFKSRLDIKLLGICILFLSSIFVYMIFNDYIIQYLDKKGDSTSGIVRVASNWNAINNFINSFGLGIGVGSERPSSLIVSMLNNLGVIFTGILLFLIFKLVKFRDNYHSYVLLISLVVVFLGCFTSIPEYTWAVIWNLIYANICCADKKYSDDFFSTQKKI